MKPGEESKLFGRPFRWRPKQVGMNPDWDLVLRAFYDYAYRGVSPPPVVPGTTIDPNATVPYIDRNFAISGTGVGIGLMIKQNFSLRCDFGMALTELRDKERTPEVIVKKGNKEVHLISSFSW